MGARNIKYNVINTINTVVCDIQDIREEILRVFITRKNAFLSFSISAKQWVFIKFIMVMIFSSVQFSSVAQSCPTLCDPISHNTPGNDFRRYQIIMLYTSNLHSIAY